METPHRGEPILISQSISGILRTSAKLGKELGQYVAKLNNDSAARQLRTQPLRLAVLGWLTWSAGLSFRGMWRIAAKMLDRDANVREPEYGDYVAEIKLIADAACSTTAEGVGCASMTAEFL